MEGTVNSYYGYCLYVQTAIQNMDFLLNNIVDDYGNAVFNIKYHAMYYNVFKDQVLFGVVEEVADVIYFNHSTETIINIRQEYILILDQSKLSLIEYTLHIYRISY